MALRILSYTALFLLHLANTDEIGQDDALPPVLPIVIYNGSTVWHAAQQVSDLFADMPKSLEQYRPQQRFFLLDESRYKPGELNRDSGLVAQIIRFEKIQTVEELEQLAEEVKVTLAGPRYAHLRRTLSVWLYTTFLNKDGEKIDLHTIEELLENNTMLEERVAEWKDMYYNQGVLFGESRGEARGEARGIAMGEARGIGIVLKEMLSERFGFIPLEIHNYINNCENADNLLRLTRSVFKVQSLQEFMEMLKPAK